MLAAFRGAALALQSSIARLPTGNVRKMVRTLDLSRWAGRWVALGESDEVCRDAETLGELLLLLEADGMEGVSVMRAPALDEPVIYGLGCRRKS